MRHLIVCREYPPASYAPGGIGTYAANIAQLLARAGETVHVVGEQWRGAHAEREQLEHGRLTVHRVPADAPVRIGRRRSTRDEITALRGSLLPSEAWAWNATLLAETLVEDAGVDIVEAQEWEGPLYFFLLRRALGLGPARMPPCIVHLHSPSEFVARHNGWDPYLPELVRLRRMEEFCIAGADALLSPSRFLAQEVSSRFGIPVEKIERIPYPVSSAPLRPRRANAAAGPVLYVGRLERRKGVLEFVEAAVNVAREDAQVRFTLVGSDTAGPDGSSTLDLLRQLIPDALRPRFEFPGTVDRPALADRLATCRFAAVPSRWENFPNTMIEAMQAGVPVLATATGGMSEVVEDGVSGWIAPSSQPSDLEATLRRALGATSDELAGMGVAARERIEATSGDMRVLDLQRAFRARVVERGVTRSGALPLTLPIATAPMYAPTGDCPAPARDAAPARTPANAPTAGAGVIARDAPELRALARRDQADVIAVLATGYALDREALVLASGIFEHCKDVGIVTGWARGRHAAIVSLCPVLPHTWLANDAWPLAFFRAAAVRSVEGDLPDGEEPFGSWALTHALMSLGWKAVSVPALVASAEAPDAPDAFDAAIGHSPRQRDEVRTAIRTTAHRLPSGPELLAAMDALERAQGGADRTQLTSSGDRFTGISVQEALRLPFREQLALFREAARRPGRVVGWLRERSAGRPT